jgi:hypothetical protein
LSAIAGAVQGAYTVSPSGDTNQAFSLPDSGSLTVNGPAGSMLTATVSNPDGTIASVSGACATPPVGKQADQIEDSPPQLRITCTSSYSPGVPIFSWAVLSSPAQPFSGTFSIDKGYKSPQGNAFPLTHFQLPPYDSTKDFGQITGPIGSTLTVDAWMQDGTILHGTANCAGTDAGSGISGILFVHTRTSPSPDPSNTTFGFTLKHLNGGCGGLIYYIPCTDSFALKNGEHDVKNVPLGVSNLSWSVPDGWLVSEASCQSDPGGKGSPDGTGHGLTIEMTGSDRRPPLVNCGIVYARVANATLAATDTPPPTLMPTVQPSNTPTAQPTNTPTAQPTNTSTAQPTNTPSPN